jgi:hypothetical protein
MLVDNLLKRVQVDCLIAFAHSRIAGVAGQEQIGVRIFKDANTDKVTAEAGKEIEDSLKGLATIEIINSKIGNKNNIGLANMYYHHYTKLLDLLDDSIPKDRHMIEGLIGLHILSLSCDLGIINNDNKEAYEYMIGLYEKPEFIENIETLEVVENMKIVSKKIFDKFWEKPKRIIKKRKKTK